jgi:agmatine/peptidylarginine deiminase
MFIHVMLLSIITMVFTTSFAGANEQWDKAKFFEERLKRVPLPPGPTDDPPPQIPFALAEWEPATGVLITYPLHIPIELVAELAEDCELWSVVPDRTYEVAAMQEYAAGGVDTSQCHFIHMGDFTTPWTRDHGPWYIFDGNDELGIIDNVYGGSSELVPQVLGDTLGIPVYATGVSTEGGNYMTDGMGRAIVTKWIHLENPQMSKEQIDRIMTGYLGFEDHMVRPIIPTYFHIDTFAKLLDPGRILVIEPDPPVASIEANVEYWSTVLSAYGRPYEIIRIQGRGYSNTLILNNKVMVPLFNDPTDSLALVTFQEAMPGYEVHGYQYQGMGGFSYGDALHCRTHEMHDRYMLRIVHVPVHDCENTGGGYYLEADIHPHSNEPLVGPPVIMWRTDGSTYSPAAMTFAEDDIYYGEIPQQPDGSDIYYYIEAEDGTGRVENHPFIGPGNPHHFQVGPDDEAPVVEFDPPANVTAAQWPIPLTTYALDNRWIESVTLEYSINGVQQDDVDMPLRGRYAVYYTGLPEGTVTSGDIVEVRVKAVDTSINQNTTYSDWYTISIDSRADAAAIPLASAVSPNPFNPTTVLSYELRVASKINLAVYDIGGRKVAELVNGWRDAGMHEVTFDGTGLASGVYIYRLDVKSGTSSYPGHPTAWGKMVLVK